MILDRTKLATVGHLDLLWHQLINRNMRHIDENLVGQGVRLPARNDVVAGMVVSYTGGQVVPGCIAGEFLGVVASIVDAHALIVLAGNVAVTLTNPALVGDFVYARDDGYAQGLTPAGAITGDFSHSRIIGTCVEAGDSSCVVAVRAKGWHGALADAPAMSAEGVICCTPTAVSRKPYLLSMAVATVGGLSVIGYSRESASNVSSISVSGNKMRFTFFHPYDGLPSVEFAHGYNKRCILNKYVTPAFVTAKLYDAAGAAMNFSSVSGDLHMVAKGAAA